MTERRELGIGLGGEKKYVGGRRKDDKEAVGERRERESEGLVDGWVWKVGMVEGGGRGE